MKKIPFLAILIALFTLNSCIEISNKKPLSDEVAQILANIDSIKNSPSPTTSIAHFQELANEQADEVFNLRRSNMGAFLELAKYYEHCIITVGEHTILHVTDFDDCETSGSWAQCMPKVEGFVRQGDWIYKKDFANNVIGKPDSQKRFAYLFNKLKK